MTAGSRGSAADAGRATFRRVSRGPGGSADLRWQQAEPIGQLGHRVLEVVDSLAMQRLRPQRLALGGRRHAEMHQVQRTSADTEIVTGPETCSVGMDDPV